MINNKKQACLDVASGSKTNGTGWSSAIVQDLLDRQSNALAQKTFSAEVETEMNRLGYVEEAQLKPC